MKYKNISSISLMFLIASTSAMAQDISLVAARANYASSIKQIKANLANKAPASCPSRQSMGNEISNAIKNIDLIIKKSNDLKELQIAKVNRAQLASMLEQSNKSYEEKCGAGAQKRRENIEIRNRYINEFNTNIINAQNFRDRAFNQYNNNYELCNLLHGERNSLSKARTDFAILSGRFPENAAQEAEQNTKLIRKIEQNQVDGKGYGCW